VQIYAMDARENGIEMLLPDVNLSAYRFEPVLGRDGKISAVRYGLGGIKGMGEGAIENILAARAEKPFTDLFDFCARVDKRLVNRRAIEALVRGGAFDELEPDRAINFASVGIAMEAAEQAEQSADQVSLFGGADDADSQEHKPELVRTLKWSARERLLNEKLALGYYLSGHLFDAYAGEVRKLVRARLADVKARGDAQLLAGVVTQMRTAMTRRGKMNILEIDDGSAKLEVTVYQELVDAHREILKPDELLVISGKVREDQFSGGMRISAEKIYGIVDLRRAYARSLKVSMNGQANVKKLMELLGPYRGGGSCPVLVEYRNGNAVCDLAMPEDWRVTPREELLQGLRDWLTPAGVEVLY